MRSWARAAGIWCVVLTAGCGWGHKRQHGVEIDAQAFYRPPSVAEPKPQAQSPGSAAASAMRDPAPAPSQPPTAQGDVNTAADATATAAEAGALPVTSDNRTAPNMTVPPDASASQAGTIGRGADVAATRPGGTTAQYMTLGAVVTHVSGTPIYADKVIQAITPLLKSEAKQRDPASYRALAMVEIEKQVRAMVRNEVWYAAAVHELDQQDKALARRLTEQWRAQQITAAGGSEALARRKAAEEGIDFDEKVNEQYRYYLVSLLYRKKIEPRVQVTAEDIRRYYEQHLRTEFTETEQAQFRVIKITAKNMGGRSQALDKIRELRERAIGMNDEEFAKLAASINHDPNLMRTAGRVGGADGWVQRGSFIVQQVEDAVWQLQQPGQVTEVIEVGDSFYIARLENRKPGRVRPFDDESVQKQIYETLARQQRARHQEQMQQKLLKQAIVDPDPPITAPVLEMAMQKYAQWAASSQTASGQKGS
ncbi:peptidyl-prolyl cis-trans isomerase [Fontivita pretiosa]|uniref:peptidylprolyl isomerase n=1 Tax=Fontivita pretiosa TaxID=2989684 RepID=UPI003D16780E